MSVAAQRFQIGQFECFVIQDKGQQFPLNYLLGDFPKTELEQVAREYSLNPEAIDFSINVLVVKTGSHIVLVDTGIREDSLPDKLKEIGIDPAAVNTVVVTHGHGDHVLGIVDPKGKFLYPNARYAIWKTEYEYWTAPEQLALEDKHPAIAVWKILRANPDKLDLIGGSEEEAEIMPGICAIAAPGHTPGHIAVSVESGGDRLLHIVDAAHNAVQVTRTDWSPNFDYDKAQSAAKRLRLFQRAARDKALVLAYHFPFPGLGHVTSEGDVLRWTARQNR